MQDLTPRPWTPRPCQQFVAEMLRNVLGEGAAR